MVTLQDLQTPALVVDARRLERNLSRMKEKAKSLGVTLRPHLKTHKCWDVARLQMETPQGPATVSTLLEAEYFASHGVKDMVYAVGIAPAKLPRGDLLSGRSSRRASRKSVSVPRMLVSTICRSSSSSML